MFDSIGRTGIEHDLALVAVAAMFAFVCAGFFWLLARAQERNAQVMLRRLKLIAETASDVIIIADNDTNKIIWANNSFTNEVGLPLDRVIGRTDAEVGIKLSSLRPSLTTILEAVRCGESIRCAVIATTPVGEKHWEGTVRGVIDPDTGACHRVTTFHDVTERVTAEQRLRDSEERFQLAIRGSNDGIWDWRVQEDVLLASPRAHELLGIREGEPHLRHMRELQQRIHPEDHQRSISRMAAHLADHTPFLVDHRLRCNDGSYRWFRTRAEAIRSECGNPVRMVGSISDIDDLIRATRDAQIASKLKSEFLANMSHEIRTPMNGVMGMMQLLQKTPLNEKQSRFVAMALSSSRALLTIINDILDLSRIESGLVSLNIDSFDMESLIEDAIARVETVATQKGLKIVRKIAPTRRGVFAGDQQRINQILINLLGNAIKFTERGEITIEVAPGEVGATCFAVRDTGIGIPPEQSAIVFERFRQVDGSSTRKHGGAGLGLAISKELVDLMKGKIGLESTAGQGSTFWFEIPLPFETRSKPETHDKLSETDKTAMMRGLRVLVAEDNPMNQRVIAETADNMGMNVRIVDNGKLAIEALEQDDYDLVLMDIQMPEMTGDVAIERIRAGNARYASIPIIVVTADVMKGSVERYLAIGGDALIPKPVELDVLVDTIRSVMEKRAKKAAA